MNARQQQAERVRGRVDLVLPRLMELADALHATPELAFSEQFAAGLMCEHLAAAGFVVETGIAGMSTAFRARLGNGHRRVILCAEYDALPGLGHACGHNLIAATSLGAALCLAPEMNDLDATLELLGTPGEECLDNGAKIRLFDAGAFDNATAVLMAHPAPFDAAAPRLAAGGLWCFSFEGDAGHAFSQAPQRNACVDDGLMLAELSLTLLGRRLGPSYALHVHRTGTNGCINVRNSRAQLQLAVRAPTMRALLDVGALVEKCMSGAALAANLTCLIERPIRPYTEFYPDPKLADIWRANLALMNRTSLDQIPAMNISTDLGIVSTLVPCLHAFIGLASDGHANHEAGFAKACRGASARNCVRDGVVALSQTALTVMTSQLE